MAVTNLPMPCTGIDPKYQYTWREYRNQDYESIELIELPNAYEMFGDLALKTLIQTSMATYVYENLSTNELCSVICFKTYPNIPAMNVTLWTSWMEKMYNNFEITSLNSYFVHYFTWCEPANLDFLIDLFRFLFTEHFYLDHIAFILPPGFSKIKSYNNLISKEKLRRIYPLLYDDQYDTQSLLVCERILLFDKIVVRRALAEDNDDLVDILDADCKELRKAYGEFYIAEIVLEVDNTRMIIVAEEKNRAIGMICVNSKVDIDKLHEYFYLDQYHGLRKHTDEENVEMGHESVIEVETEFQDIMVSKLDDVNNKEESVNDLEFDDNIEEDVSLEEGILYESCPLHNIFGDEFDIFKQFAFDSSSDSGSSVYERDLTSDTLWQGKTENVDENKKLKFNVSSTNLIWGQLSINSSTRNMVNSNINKAKVKHQGTATSCFKQPKLFFSDSNAFIIELYGIRSNYDKRLTYLLLEAAFETFPDRDYCLITMPSNNVSFIGLQYFVQAVSRPCVRFEHELFLLYKYAMYGKICVRISNVDDLPEITEFIKDIPKSGAVQQTIEELILNYFYLKFVILVYSNQLLIGLVILQPCSELYFLKTNFEVSSYVDLSPENRIESNGFVKYFTLAPMFCTKLSVILAEIFRLTEFNQIFYYVKDSNKREPHTTILPLMFPIRPRRRIVYHPDKMHGHVPPDYVLQDPPLIALYTLGINSIHQRKSLVTLRIVVVGCSTTALSFLETLIFEKPAQKLYFVNLILITPHNHFESMIAENESIKLARPNNIYYSYKYLQRLSLRTWVNIVHGHVKKIDKNKKTVITNHDRIVSYDVLYLFTGLEFGLPHRIAYTQKSPVNCLTINSWDDVEMIQVNVSILKNKDDKHPIIVYGRTIEAYCIINFFLQTLPNIVPYLVFVLPPTETKLQLETSTFNDGFVEHCITDYLTASSVKIYDGYEITKWDVDKHNVIRTVVLESKFELCNIDCSMIISFDRKSVGILSINAFKNSGLVFDGRLVINKSFQTNDPNIFAAGPVTKYRRILYADSNRHEYYNSAEVGREVAMRLIAKHNHDLKLHVEIKDLKFAVHKFTVPVIVNCVLPSGLNYLHIATPGEKIPHRAAILKDNYGIDIMTGYHSYYKKTRSAVMQDTSMALINLISINKLADCVPMEKEEKPIKSVHYFRCHLNEFNLVETIVCLTESQIDVQNIINLYGKHEKLLNNLAVRYEAKLIDDLFDFFQNSNWIYAVAHDQFACLQHTLNAKFFNSMVSDKILTGDIIDLFKKNHWSKLTDEKKLQIIGSYLFANRQTVEKHVIKFLTDYKDELPIFILPEDVPEFIKCLTLETVCALVLDKCS